MAKPEEPTVRTGDPLRLALAIGRLEKRLRAIRAAAVAVWVLLAAVRILRVCRG